MNAIVFDDNVASLALFGSLGFVQDRRSILHGKLLERGGAGRKVAKRESY